MKLSTEPPITTTVEDATKTSPKITMIVASVSGIPFFLSQWSGARLIEVINIESKTMLTRKLACLSPAITIITDAAIIQNLKPPRYERNLVSSLFIYF